MSDSSSNFPVVQISITKNFVAIVDTCDADLANLRWYTISGTYTKYAIRNSSKLLGPQKRIKMHRVILERILGRALVKGETVDHINRDGLDNRRSNLRLATKSQNAQNTPEYSRNTSGYKGVSWAKDKKMWVAQIRAQKKTYRLGYFIDIDDAARAYNEAALKYHGEFAYQNDVSLPAQARQAQKRLL